MDNIRPFRNHLPQLGTDVYIDPAAVVIGRVELGDGVSVWPFAVLRGDVNFIRVGARSNIQDGSVLHGCTVGSRVLIGMGAVVLDDAIIEDDVILGAGSLVPPRKRLDSGFLYTGSPAKAARPLTDAERTFLQRSAQTYLETARAYREGV